MSELVFQHCPLRVDEIPVGWELIALSAFVAEVQTGFASGEHNSDGQGVPHLRPMNITPDGAIDLTDLRSVAPEENTLRLRRGDVLFNNTNSPVWVGKTAYIDTDIELAFSNHMTRIRATQEIDARFLAKQIHFLCTSGYFQHQCKKHVNQASINRSFLAESTPFLLPPPGEQRRITKKIEALQERSRNAREALEEVGPLLEQFRQSLLAAAFRGDLTADWRAANPNVEPASELLNRIRQERRQKWEQSEVDKHEAKGKQPPKDWRDKYEAPQRVDNAALPVLPQGWCWASLDELLREPLANGKSVRDGTGVPVLRLTSLQNRRIELSENKQGDWSDVDVQRFLVEQNDFLLSRGNGSLDLVGRGGIVEAAPLNPIAFPDTLIRVRLNPVFDVGYFAMLWDSPVIRKQILAAAKTTAGIYKVNQSDLEAFVLPLMPIDEQRRIKELLGEALMLTDATVNRLAIQNSTLAQLDQSILAKAFRGELVPQDPNDEPASELLARIRKQRDEATLKKTSMPRKARKNI